jgi:hypothetical protein
MECEGNEGESRKRAGWLRRWEGGASGVPAERHVLRVVVAVVHARCEDAPSLVRPELDRLHREGVRIIARGTDSIRG